MQVLCKIDTLRYNFLKYDDIGTLNPCVFMRQYSNKKLSMSFQDMFKCLPLSQQVFRDHDYNFIPKEVTRPHLKFYPIVQMLRTWNASYIFVKSEAEIVYLKETFITPLPQYYTVAESATTNQGLPGRQLWLA